MTGVGKRSVTIRGHRTSYSVEQAFYDELRKFAAQRQCALAALVAEIDEQRPRDTNLSSALRLYVLDRLRERDAERRQPPETGA